MGKRENKSKYAILGILNMSPGSGYDIKKLFEEKFSYFWNESYGQIYPILRRLSAEGLTVCSVKRQTGKPDRHIYSITDRGRKVLRSWLLEPAKRQVGRHEIILKLIFGDHVTVKDQIDQIEQFKNHHIRELDEMKNIRKQLESIDHKSVKPYWLMSAKYGQYLNKAYINWADDTLTELRRLMENS